MNPDESDIVEGEEDELGGAKLPSAAEPRLFDRVNKKLLSRFLALLGVTAIASLVALTIAGPFGSKLQEVEQLEALRTVDDSTEQLEAPVTPGSPASPATPATAAAPGTPASPRAAESGQASEDKPADKQSAQNGDAKDDAAREPAAEQQHVQAPQAAPVPDARSEEKPSAQTPEQGAQPEKTDPPAQTEDDPAPSTEPETLEVEVTVDGSAVGSDVWSRSVTLEPGSTVYDALVKTGVDVNARSTVYGIYVAAIGGLAEKEFGPLSGWVYAVDGVEPQVAASGKLLRDGQRITWTYVNVE